VAAEWAYAFYHSKTWKQCRLGFLKSKYWLCERCGRPARIAHHKRRLSPKNINDPYITLDWRNLEAVCEECHNREHFGTIEATRPGFAFDADGDLVRGDTHGTIGA
jgi:ribosomal protein S27AE